MPQLSPLEILTVGVIALIVFGPDKLPQIARTIGRTLSELRRMASDVKDEFEAGLRVDDAEEERPRVHRETRRGGDASRAGTADGSTDGPRRDPGAGDAPSGRPPGVEGAAPPDPDSHERTEPGDESSGGGPPPGAQAPSP